MFPTLQWKTQHQRSVLCIKTIYIHIPQKRQENNDIYTIAYIYSFPLKQCK